MDYLLPVIIGAVIGAAALYYIVHAAVLSAMREHSVWTLAGGADELLKKRIEARKNR